MHVTVIAVNDARYMPRAGVGLGLGLGVGVGVGEGFTLWSEVKCSLGQNSRADEHKTAGRENEGEKNADTAARRRHERCRRKKCHVTENGRYSQKQPEQRDKC